MLGCRLIILRLTRDSPQQNSVAVKSTCVQQDMVDGMLRNGGDELIYIDERGLRPKAIDQDRAVGILHAIVNPWSSGHVS